MAEMEDQRKAPGVEMEDQRHAPGVEEHTERPRAMMAAVVALLLLVPAAFVAGWRTRRGLGRLTGY
jgi:hypothetical protein